jgi:outer membrane protein TolC
MSCPFPRAAALAAVLLPALSAAAPFSLDDAVARAEQRSHAVRSADAGVRSAQQAAQAAGQLPDPMLGVGIENLPATGPERFSTTREGMTMKRIALSQEWVSAGKRTLRTDAARAQLAREAANLGAARADTRLQTALAFIEAYYAGQALSLGMTSEAHAREAFDAARARLSAGSANTPDVLAASAALGTGMDEAAEARQQWAAAAVALARWTGTQADELIAPSIADAAAEAPWVEAHPLVVARRRDVVLAQKEAAVVVANRRPNWTWELAYGQRTGAPDLVSVGVNIPLPIAPAARQDRDSAAKLALVEKAEAELAEAERAAGAEYRVLAGDAQRLQERIRSLRGALLAPAAQRTAAARAALGGNQASLATVFEARHAELEARRKVLMLERDLAKVRAQLAFKPVRAEDLQ